MAPGLSPKHAIYAIYAFSIYIVQVVYLSFELECEMNKNKQKEARISPFFKLRKNQYIFPQSRFIQICVSLFVTIIYQIIRSRSRSSNKIHRQNSA